MSEQQRPVSLTSTLTFRALEEAVQQMKCRTCGGLGECDDSEPGDIAYRTWKCRTCKGSGFAPIPETSPTEPESATHPWSNYLRSKVNEHMQSIRATLGVPAPPTKATSPVPLKHGDTHAECGGQWCDYVREEYTHPNMFPPSDTRQSRTARFIQIGLMCDKCGVEHLTFVPPESWIERAARCAQSILQEVLEGVTPQQGDGTTVNHLRWMAETLANRGLDSDTKACRWLGYLQAGLVMRGLSTLEREKCRNLDSLSPTAPT